MAEPGKKEFWDSIDGRIDEGVEKARRQNRSVCGIRVVWHLFIAPLIVFIKSFLLSATVVKGGTRLRTAVHDSMLHFCVNARLYELTRGDRSELDKIKKEW